MRRLLAARGPELVTVPNVPLCSTGIEYQLSTGPMTFTPEMLMDAVAAQDDPAIHQPRIKLGHLSAVNGGVDGWGDAEPAFGKVVSMRLGDNGQTIYADLAGVPQWLADVMPVAYPSRSIEGQTEVETVTGHKWRLVLDGLALLGVVSPGVSTLEDLPTLYGAEMPAGVTVTASTNEEDDVKVAATRIAAAVNMEDVRRDYYATLGPDQMWWWIRAIYLDPNELIVDDDEGGLYRVPFDVKGEDINFKDPVEVKIQYVDASRDHPDVRAAVATAQAGRLKASFASRAASRPETNPKEESMNIDITRLRDRLGLTAEQLPDDATEEQINAALAEGDPQPAPEPGAQPEAPAAPAPAPSGPQPAEPAEPGSPTPGEAPAPAEPQPANASATGTVTVDAAAWEETRRQAQQGAEVAARMRREDRDRTIAAAIGEGRIPPSRREHYERSWAADEQGTRTLLTASADQGGLAPGTVPVEAQGGNPPEQDLSTSAYPGEWLPEVAARAHQGNGGSRVTVSEG